MADFSANAYLDVYNGHINMFSYIKEQQEGAYHVMMADIYAQAKWVVLSAPLDAPFWLDRLCSTAEQLVGAPIAGIDLSILKGWMSIMGFNKPGI